MQAQEIPTTGQPSPPNVMEATDTENQELQESWLPQHVRFYAASVLEISCDSPPTFQWTAGAT